MEIIHFWRIVAMNFPKRLVTTRKAQGFTQQTLADAVGMHVNQIKKYEAGKAQPTLSALIKLAQTLHVSLDALVFDEGECGPDEDLRLQFDAVSSMPAEEKKIIKALLEGMIIKHQTKQMVSNLSD
jgi:transcriptional regulator with XRE-family HTH domain